MVTLPGPSKKKKMCPNHLVQAAPSPSDTPATSLFSVLKMVSLRCLFFGMVMNINSISSYMSQNASFDFVDDVLYRD